MKRLVVLSLWFVCSLTALSANPSLPDALARAKAGDAGSQYIVGMMYMIGQGTRQDLPEAGRWLEVSAAAGLPQAQVALAALADVGQGLPLDTERAPRVRQPAADAGNPIAGGQLEELRKLPGQAECMRARVLVDLKMLTLAIPHARRAADQGSADARFLMGWFNPGGNGMPVDFAEARAYHQKAAGQGYVDAMRGLAYMNEFGQGGKVDRKAALAYCDKAAASGSALAKRAAANLRSPDYDARRAAGGGGRAGQVPCMTPGARVNHVTGGCDLPGPSGPPVP